MRLAVYCVPHPEKITSKLVLWQSTEGQTGKGRPNVTFIGNFLGKTLKWKTQRSYAPLWKTDLVGKSVFKLRVVLADDQDR